MKRNLIFGYLSIGLVLLGGADALAKDIVLQESVVHPEYAEINNLKSTKEVIVIRKEDIKSKGYQSINEILADQPSINVGLTGYGDIDIRGMGAANAKQNVQILLDGAPITVLTQHPFSNDYNYIPVDQIEKIEIIPGGGSVAYGGGVAGGVIHITTNLRNIKGSERHVKTEISSKLKKGTLSLGGRLSPKWTYRVGATRENKEYYFDNTWRHVGYYSLALGYELSKKDDFTLRASKLDERGQFLQNVTARNFYRWGKNYQPRERRQTIGLDEDGNKITIKARPYLNADRELDQVNFTWKHAVGNFDMLVTDVFYSDGYFKNNDDYDKQMNIGTKGTRMRYEHGYGSGRKHSLVVGMDYMQQDAKLAYDDYRYNRQTKRYELNPLHFFYRRDTAAVYASNHIRTGRWDLTQGIRLDRTTWKFDKKEARSEGVASRRTNEIAWDLGVAYHYTDTGHVYAHYEKGFTTPDGIMVADSNGSVSEPTKADNEHYDMYEIGLRDKLGISTVKVTGFYTKTDNQLDRWLAITPNGLVRWSDNLLKTTRKGVEVSLTQRFGKLKLTEQYTYLRGKSRWNDGAAAKAEAAGKSLYAITQQALKQVPKHKVGVRAEWRASKEFSTGISYSYVGRYITFTDDENADGNTVRAHSLVDWDWKWMPNSEVTVYGGVQNVLNEKYASYMTENNGGYYSLFPGDERRVYFGIERKF